MEKKYKITERGEVYFGQDNEPGHAYTETDLQEFWAQICDGEESFAPLASRLTEAGWVLLIGEEEVAIEVSQSQPHRSGHRPDRG